SSRPLEKSLSRAHDLRARQNLDVAPPAVSAEERRRSAQQRLRDRGVRSHQTFEPRLDERWSTHANMRRSDGFTRSDTVWNRHTRRLSVRAATVLVRNRRGTALAAKCPAAADRGAAASAATAPAAAAAR